MLKVDYEVYRRDYWIKSCTVNFSSLEALEDWIFAQMKCDYTERFAMWFPTPKKLERIGRNPNMPITIEIRPVSGGDTIMISQISNNDGIIFSDGKLTSGKRHWSKNVKEWLIHCEERRLNP